jgi:hypothetical protein
VDGGVGPAHKTVKLSITTGTSAFSLEGWACDFIVETSCSTRKKPV